MEKTSKIRDNISSFFMCKSFHNLSFLRNQKNVDLSFRAVYNLLSYYVHQMQKALNDAVQVGTIIEMWYKIFIASYGVSPSNHQIFHYMAASNDWNVTRTVYW